MELAIILMILLIVVAVGAIKLNDNSLSFPFKKKTNLFTPTERTFLQLIEAAVGNQIDVRRGGQRRGADETIAVDQAHR